MQDRWGAQSADERNLLLELFTFVPISKNVTPRTVLVQDQLFFECLRQLRQRLAFQSLVSRRHSGFRCDGHCDQVGCWVLFNHHIYLLLSAAFDTSQVKVPVLRNLVNRLQAQLFIERVKI
jgi:hypothetical protein